MYICCFSYEVADRADSARSTFEALAIKFMDLNLKEIAFDVSTGVVARTAIPNCRQLYMKGKALVLMDPIKDGWNLTAKVEEGKVGSICAQMREHFERYLDDPGVYLQSMRTGWPPRPAAWPTIDDSRMAEEAGSREKASAAKLCYATPPPPAAPLPQHHAAYPTPQHQPQVPSAPAAAAGSAASSSAQQHVTPFVAAGSAAPPPLPFDGGQHIEFLREESLQTHKGLKGEPVRVFTCEWRGTHGHVGKFSMSIPKFWTLAKGKIPIALMLPGADDRRVFAPGKSSGLNAHMPRACSSVRWSSSATSP